MPVCGVGASAGGVEALAQLFGVLPPDLGVAYLIALHLAPDRKSELPEILSRRTTMPVVQVGDDRNMQLQPDHVYVIAPGRKLVITDSSVGSEPFHEPRGHRMAIDLMFRSLAEAHGDGFALVLSGSGSDGAAGAKAIKEHGGLILVQDPEEASYPEMPRAAIATGAADEVLPIVQLAARLAEFVRARSRILPLLQDEKEPEPIPIPSDEAKALAQLFEILRKSTGHDFSKYKRSTVLRRLSRRMQLSGQLSIADYLRHL